MQKKTASIKAWLAKADEDWRAMQIILREGDGLWGPVCFHAQQAVEKWLKAFLVSQGVLPPKTHDLNTLLHGAAQIMPTLAKFEKELQVLSSCAVGVRYPGIVVPTPRKGRAMARSATRMRKALLPRLERDAR